MVSNKIGPYDLTVDGDTIKFSESGSEHPKRPAFDTDDKKGTFPSGTHTYGAGRDYSDGEFHVWETCKYCRSAFKVRSQFRWIRNNDRVRTEISVRCPSCFRFLISAVVRIIEDRDVHSFEGVDYTGESSRISYTAVVKQKESTPGSGDYIDDTILFFKGSFYARVLGYGGSREHESEVNLHYSRVGVLEDTEIERSKSGFPIVEDE